MLSHRTPVKSSVSLDIEKEEELDSRVRCRRRRTHNHNTREYHRILVFFCTTFRRALTYSLLVSELESSDCDYGELYIKIMSYSMLRKNRLAAKEVETLDANAMSASLQVNTLDSTYRLNSSANHLRIRLSTDYLCIP